MSEAPRELSLGDIEELVIDGGGHKRWVFNAFAERQRKRIVSEATNRPVFEIGRMITRIGVKGCPRPRFDRPYCVNGKPFPTVEYDCAFCKHFLGLHEKGAVICDA